MRIVITKLGKNEIKEVDYEEIPYNNILTQKNNSRTISYNKIPKQLSIYDSNKKLKIRNNNSLNRKIEYTQFPSINKSNSNINTTLNNQNNQNSFLSKIGEFATFPQKYKTPNKRRINLQLNKKNINNPQLSNRNENKLFNTNFNNYENLFKKVTINPKKINMPVAMLDKYSKKAVNENDKNNNNNNLDIFHSNKNLTINTEGDSILDKNKMYSLREILLPRNQKNIDDSDLDKKINSNGSERIISYLKSDKDISPFLIKKINKSNNEQLYKLDKICQKYFNDEKVKNSLDNIIKIKIKKEYELDSIYCKNNLNNMNLDLKNYNNVYKKLRLKKENYENFKNMYLSHKK